MTKWLESKPVEWLIAIALGGIFLYAAVAKIQEPREFARIIYHYRLLGPSAHLPHLLPNTLAVTLPWIEALAGLLLVTSLWRREAALLTAAMLVVFLVAVTYALVMGIDVQKCGCFGSHGEGRALGTGLLAGDTTMLIAALWLARISKHERESA
jgi:uncharacterized membrane protein YphA (DoxX/SURF4 family)